MKIFTKSLLTASIMMGIFVSSVAQADVVFRWKDESGSVHYSPNRPWGVKYEEIDTNYSQLQRELIEEINEERHSEEIANNREKLEAEQAKKKKEEMQRLQVCIDITYDKMAYQKRRIEDDSIKQKQDCNNKYPADTATEKNNACILEIESARMKKLQILEQGISHCINKSTTQDMIDAAMAKHRDNASVSNLPNTSIPANEPSVNKFKNKNK